MSDIPAAMRDSLGKVQKAEDYIAAAPVAAMMATVGRDAPPPKNGDALPETWHGLFCTTKLPPWKLGPDGMSKEETLLPSLDGFPRRMFGGARYTFHQPLHVGESITKESEIAHADLKEGRSGSFIVAVVQHRIIGPNGLAVTEENDILYRPGEDAPAPKPAASAPADASQAQAKSQAKPQAKPTPPGEAAWRRSVTPDPVVMFRHSALIFNSHRIHYDRDWATKEEGYPGLVVMGGMIARELLELLWAEMPGTQLASFAFRSGRPLFDTAPFSVEGAPDADGKGAKLWALDSAGFPAMTAEAGFK